MSDEIKTKVYRDEIGVQPQQQMAQEWVIVLRSKDGDISGFIRRDPDNHGRVQMFSAQTASWEEVLPLLIGANF